MTNRIALVLGLLIAGFFVLDHYVLHWDAIVTVMRLFVQLINWVAFWR